MSKPFRDLYKTSDRDEVALEQGTLDALKGLDIILNLQDKEPTMKEVEEISEESQDSEDGKY